MTLALLGIAVLVVAYTNGANDNAKGVAVLAGSRMLSLSAALRYGNCTTVAGALAAVPVAIFINTVWCAIILRRPIF